MSEEFPQKKKFHLTIHHIFGLTIALLLVFGGVLFARQEKLIKENENRALLAEQKSSEIAIQSNQKIESVKDELEQLKIKSAEENAELERKAQEASEKKPIIIEKIVNNPTTPAIPTVSSIVKTWQPVTAKIVCEFRYTDGVLYGKQSGSGTLITLPTGVKSIVTNKHVVADKLGYGPWSCSINFPSNANTYTIGIDDITLSLNGSDMANIKVNSIPTTLGGNTVRSYCNKIPDIGDQIVILGYPSIGGAIDITATEGIISGYENNYYVTSAKVEQGNSGGSAIDLQNNCYLGIPTFVQAGQIESLARILKWQAF